MFSFLHPNIEKLVATKRKQIYTDASPQPRHLELRILTELDILSSLRHELLGAEIFQYELRGRA